MSHIFCVSVVVGLRHKHAGLELPNADFHQRKILHVVFYYASLPGRVEGAS